MKRSNKRWRRKTFEKNQCVCEGEKKRVLKSKGSIFKGGLRGMRKPQRDYYTCYGTPPAADRLRRRAGLDVRRAWERGPEARHSPLTPDRWREASRCPQFRLKSDAAKLTLLRLPVLRWIIFGACQDVYEPSLLPDHANRSSTFHAPHDAKARAGRRLEGVGS